MRYTKKVDSTEYMSGIIYRFIFFQLPQNLSLTLEKSVALYV